MKHIIIVDDDPGIQELFTHMFDPGLYRLTIYHNGNALLDKVITPPDLFILDKQLSGVDGTDICRYLKSRPATRSTPVILLSASPHIARLAADAGAQGAMEKPFQVAELRALVRQLLGSVR